MQRALAKDNLAAPIIGVDNHAGHKSGYHRQMTAEFEEALNNAPTGSTCMISGHYRYRDIRECLKRSDRKVHLVTSLRDPVKRFISDYLYCTSDRHTDQKGFLERFPDFETYLNTPLQYNKQLQYLQPYEGASFLETIEAIKRDFYGVMLVERFDDDSEQLLRRLGLSVPQVERVNTAKKPTVAAELFNKYGDQIREKSAEEIALYEAFADPSMADYFSQFDQERPAVFSPEKRKSLEQEIESLGPWHHRIDMGDGLFTAPDVVWNETREKVSVVIPSQKFRQGLKGLFPYGLDGRSFLDCGCNAGGYCFAAKDAGAARTFGFDVREHWIDQARFVAQNRSGNSEGMRFEVADLLNLKAMPEDFDVTWFSGLFYHLPDPVAGLKIAADKTRDILFITTATRPLASGADEGTSLTMKFESTEALMSGVHRLSWLPDGPKSMKKILNWLGFPETRVLFWYKRTSDQKRHGLGRMAIVAAREKGRLRGYKEGDIVDVV
ncbi:2-polyprenyl-3-methyl-5-hydroxy-6-metoxy-1,4-benzoquinol methylase [Shimia isoporae]|uniref:2-polyprenyl-3-methyl-5-hydroxy-6-metoxy-1, 4-benzoquinol methylase n=2 Tax=Shimia isoporae TaxID=647720 RepID=A0A4R1NLC1_9RHOB|nr:2-polyprenyl-3-methyl-5-hydroxy-6-metoxy-1,4-benzoquinol methylase [Shimia isoporae]